MDVLINPTGKNSQLDSQGVKTKVKRPKRPVSVLVYSGDITNNEIQMVKLTAQTCREINARAKDDADLPGVKPSSSCGRKNNKITNTYANDAFFVKTTNRQVYGSSLAIGRHLVYTPTTMCPDVDSHVDKIYRQKHTLPLACPTCWSLQRNCC